MKTNVILIWKRASNGTERKWVFVAESAALHGLDPIGNDAGIGLYAWRDFGRDETIGRYSGRSLGQFDADDEEGIAAAIGALAAGTRDKIMELQRDTGKVELIDGAGGPAPYLERANDAHGLAGCTNSAFMTAQGVLKSMRHNKPGHGARWGTVPPGSGWPELQRREILWSYGQSYWKPLEAQRKAQEAGRNEEPQAGGAAETARTAGQRAAPQARDDAAHARQQEAAAAARRAQAERDARQQRRTRTEETASEAPIARQHGIMVGEIGNTNSLRKPSEQVRCMFVSEMVVARGARRRGAARAMLRTALERSDAEEVYLIVRADAEQQHDMRKWCTAQGLTRTEDGEHLPYRPRSGDAHQREECWVGYAPEVMRKLEAGGDTRTVTTWTEGGGGQLLPAEWRKTSRALMRQMHEGTGGSHEGRTWDEREVIPRRGGFSVVAHEAAHAATDSAPATAGGSEGGGSSGAHRDSAGGSNGATGGGADGDQEGWEPAREDEWDEWEQEAMEEAEAECDSGRAHEVANEWQDPSEDEEQYEREMMESPSDKCDYGAGLPAMEAAENAARAEHSRLLRLQRDAAGPSNLESLINEAEARVRALMTAANSAADAPAAPATRTHHTRRVRFGSPHRADAGGDGAASAEEAESGAEETAAGAEGEEEESAQEGGAARAARRIRELTGAAQAHTAAQNIMATSQARQREQQQARAHVLGKGGVRAHYRRSKGISVTNVNGLHMMRRHGQKWGDGRDLYAGPGAKLSKLRSDAEDENAVLLVWTETHVSGDELEALRGHMQAHGWDIAATGGYIAQSGAVRGGVVVAWDTRVFTRERAREKTKETEEVTRGRIAHVRLVALECGSRVHVIGAYAPGRNGEAAEAGSTKQRAEAKRAVEKTVKEFWAQLQAVSAGDETAVIAGDLNAELQSALARYGRQAKQQDRTLAALVGSEGRFAIAAEEATWSNGKTESEIDHVIVHQNQRHLWGRAEVRPGVGSKDHRTLWVEYKGGAQGKEGRGETRAQGGNWAELSDAQWTKYTEEVKHRVAAVAQGGGRGTIEAIQHITREAGDEQLKLLSAPKRKGGDAEAEGADDTPSTEAPRTREDHLIGIARWQRLTEDAQRWSGRSQLHGMSKDGAWLAKTQTGKEFVEQTRGVTRELRRAALETICEEAREEAVREATRISEHWEVDEVEARIRDAIEHEPETGGAYAALFDILDAARGRGKGGGAKLTALYAGDDRERGTEVHGAGPVREEARRIGQDINQDKAVAIEVVRAIMETARAPRRRPPPTHTADWVEDVCTWDRFKAGLARTKPRKGVGCDGWNAYLLRKAPEEVQRRYFEAMKVMLRERRYPDEWKEKIAMLYMKPGEDPMELGRRRDIWLECHGLKLTMWVLGAEYERAAEGVIPTSQAGNEHGRGCPEQTLVMRCQKEQCAAERTMCCRAYLDMGVFFMSCIREVQWEAERWCGVRPEVSDAVRALYDGAHGKYETAYGLTDRFDLARGNTQGCSQSPCRSKMQLRMVQEAVSRLCVGFRFRGAEHSTPELWYCDDGAFCVPDLHALQMVMDTCWMVTRAAGLSIQIKKDKKTAWQASYWEDGVEKEVTDWEVRLPDGRVVPRVEKAYTYLGSAEPATWQHAQDGVRAQVIQTCTKLLRLIGRTGTLGERQMRVAMGLAVEGTIGFYGRATAIGWEACEEIERVRAEVLRQRGYASGEAKVQVHAPREAGGLDHRHAYQHAAAVLVDEVERALGAHGTPAAVAVGAHMQATCMRLGWMGNGDVREWWPTHLEHTLDEDIIGEAWLLARLRSGIRHVGGAAPEQPPEQEGPPLWEPDARPEWRAKEAGPCRVRVGLARTGGLVTRVTSAGKGCEYTHRARALAAAGVRAWADVTHEGGGRQRTWAEMRERYPTLREADRAAFDALVGELAEERWADVRGLWQQQTSQDEWQEWAQQQRRRDEGAGEGTVLEVKAARRAPAHLGGWELLVRWAGGWADSWQAEAHLYSGGRRLSRELQRQAHDCKAQPVPGSLRERITEPSDGQGGQEDRRTKWRDVQCGGVRMRAEEVEAAVEGELSEPRARRALLKLWQVFEGHAQEAHQMSGSDPARHNLDERPEKRDDAPSRPAWRSLYAGEERRGDNGDTTRHAALASEEEAEDSELVHVTVERATRRVEIKRAQEQRGGAWSDAVPASRVDVHMNWSETDDDRCVWRYEAAAGFGQAWETHPREDALMRVAVRHGGWEAGNTVIHTSNGMPVALDAEEQRVMGHVGEHAAAEADRACRATAEVTRVGAALHIEHHFTDVWATDGSKGKVWEDGAWHTRVAGSAYRGAVPVDASGAGFEADAKRSIGLGMRGMRLPATYEVVDAELHAILLALNVTAGATNAAQRRCLIISDSLTALTMVEEAWRKGVRWDGPSTGRAALLHAITSAREELDRVVMMWTPAHRGVSMNAYADAIAKAHLRAAYTTRATDMVMERLPAARRAQVVRAPEGEVLWAEDRFAAVREALGWWVRRRELTPRHATTVDATWLGPKWEVHKPRWWHAVYAGTGARTTGGDGAQGDAGAEPSQAGARVLAAATQQAERKGGGKSKARVTQEEVRDDKGRCALAMAARAGTVWEASAKDETRGCAACCSRARGFGWAADVSTGRRRWVGAAGSTTTAATLWHVTCGECVAIPEQTREDERERIRGGLQSARRVLASKRTRQALDADERARVEHVVASAQRALAKGEARSTPQENGALRAWLAGVLPEVRCEGKVAASAERAVARAVRRSQSAAARLREAWHEAGRCENARRAERDGGREGARWRGIGLDAWKQGHHAAKLDEGAREEEGRHGWTMAAALVWHLRRKRAASEARKNGREREEDTHNTQPQASGSGVVVFDVETTELIDEDVPVSDMQVSVACATWIPEAATARAARDGAADMTAWHTAVHRGPDGAVAARMQDMLRWFDDARVIVAYNGRSFDMQVLQQYYDGDMSRWRAHGAKLHDPMDAARRAVGRRVKLDAVLKHNGVQGKTGAGADAPRWWQEGKLAHLEQYCKRDVEALVELVLKPTVRLPGMHTTCGMSVLYAVQSEEAAGGRKRTHDDAAREEDDGGAGASAGAAMDVDGADANTGAATSAGSGSAHSGNAVADAGEAPQLPDAGASEATPQSQTSEIDGGRARRKRKAPEGRYDETKRRVRRKKRVGHMERGQHGGALKRKGIEVGPAVVTRVTRGRYEWRNATLTPLDNG